MLPVAFFDIGFLIPLVIGQRKLDTLTLQGIIGSAELLENGMVKQEDVPRFVGHIRKEAQRLVTLIGDIIRLSQLDEGDEMPRATQRLPP